MIVWQASSNALHRVKVAILGDNSPDDGLDGDYHRVRRVSGDDLKGMTLEKVVALVATCGRGFRGGSTRLRCMSPLGYKLRRLSPLSSLVVLSMVAVSLIFCIYMVYSPGTGKQLRIREKVPKMGWDEYIEASKRPHLDKNRLGRLKKKWRKHVPRKGRKEATDSKLNDVGWKQVSDVIGLMAKKIESNDTMKPAAHKHVLMSQIKLLREAMISEHSKLPVMERPPTCVGDVKEGEVEDLFCIPRPNFIPHIKNPCWYVTPKTSEDSIPPLKCLPYFHILGTAKSATTDLWNRLMSHPHVISNDGLLHKEALWWSWQRYGFVSYKQRAVQTFDEYVDLFQDAARQIHASMESETLHQQILITGEASPPDFWDYRGWKNISQNRYSNSPQVTTPHLMRHMYPDPKFILQFREPIDRLYSDYYFTAGGLTPQDFHNDVLAAIDILAKCVKANGVLRCFHDTKLYMKLPVRLPYACYFLYMRDWLAVFPRKNFLILTYDEYKEDLEGTLRKVMEFLGLGPLKEAQLEEIAEEEKSRITESRRKAGPMFNETRDILHELLDPCTRSLSTLLDMKSLDWTKKDSSS